MPALQATSPKSNYPSESIRPLKILSVKPKSSVFNATFQRGLTSYGSVVIKKNGELVPNASKIVK